MHKIIIGETMRPDCPECHGSGDLRDDELIKPCSFCVCPYDLTPNYKYRLRVFTQDKGINFIVDSFHFKAANDQVADRLATRYYIRNELFDQSYAYNFERVGKV